MNDLSKPETTWAYLAGMVDGEGCMSIFRHYKNRKVSKRGYEVEPRLMIANMNKETLTDIIALTGLGRVTTLVLKRKDQDPFENYEIRYNVGEQRIILPKILPYLMQKKDMAEIVLRLLNYRLDPKDRAFTENFYLELEEEYRCAMIKSKPWLLLAVQQRGKLCQRNLNLIKAYQTHTYIRNNEPSRYKGKSPCLTSSSETGVGEEKQ